MQVDLTIQTQEKSLKQILNALRRRLTFQDNIQCQILTIADTGAAATPFSVTHKLGKVPTGYIANLSLHGSVRDVNRMSWTTSTMELEVSVANASMTLVVF